MSSTSCSMDLPFANTVPKTKLVFERSNFSSPKSAHDQLLNVKYFTHQATIIVPCDGLAMSLPTQIGDLEKQQMCHLIHAVPLHHLVDKYFLEAFAKKGQLYVLSYQRHIDTQNCVAVLPTGHLVLHLTKDTYEQLGLDGKPSKFSSKQPSKYVVEIDLKPDCFTPGRKGYDRVLWCLKDRLDLTFDLLVSWTPHDEEISPTSVSKFFETKGFQVSPAPLSVRTQWLYNVSTPVLDTSSTQETEESCGREEFWEWLGAVACDVDMSESSPDSYLSTLCCPSPSVTCTRCCVLTITGLLTPAATTWLLDKVRCEVETHKETATKVRWGSLTLHGFLDCPVSVGSREHGFFQEGDNLHSFVVFHNQDYWLYSAYGQHDLCQ